MELHPGQMLGPYHIIRQIGLGGMATVYQAYQPAMDRNVAIKVLPRRSAESPEFMGRFHQEARTIAKLEHPHILPVHDFGESEGIPYFVMRYFESGTLLDRLMAGPLSMAEVDRLFTQLAEALGYAHSRGVIHRDVKPSNALIDERGDLFLTDFGVAKLLAGTSNFTETGNLGPGTPTYMSPEQAQGEILDQRSDIYSLGIVLYEMLLGRVPYQAETPLAVLLKHLQEPLPLPSTRMPAISPVIERVLLKALAKEREARFDSTASLLDAWKRALAEVDLSKHPQPLAATPAIIPATVRDSKPAASPVKPPATPAVPSTPKRWSLAWMAGTAALLLLLFSAITIGNQLRQQAVTASTPASTGVPQVGSDSGAPGSVSWAAGNTVFGITPSEEQLLAWGPGGLTLW
ncbi:MAG: serine/threonine protein kinase, partial [Ardenticatenales bacterium]|nr:serine/threonine protein kinase [Ardenticatenales bacterium]